MSESMIIDGIAGSAAIDSSGEILDVEGCDISDLENGVATLTWEHKNEKDPAHTAMDHVGKITFAKKVFSAKDCSNDRELMYWGKVGLPFIYFKTRLYDGSGHPAAIALAAMFRDAEAHGEPVIARYSIEGATLKREGNTLKKTIVRRVTATVKPCNRSAESGILYDPKEEKSFKDESKKKEESSDLASLVERTTKSEAIHGPLGGSVEMEYVPLDKTLTAGSMDAAPSTLTGGAALQREDRSLRLKNLAHRATEAMKKWDMQQDVKEYLKSELPDVDPDFVDRFAEMAEKFKVRANTMKKSEAGPEEDEMGGVDTLSGKKVILAPHLMQKFKKTRGSRPSPTSLGEAYFDSATGTLHTHIGSFPMNVPTDKHYPKILKSRDVAPHHDEAMKHWKNLNALMRDGKLPPEVIMHAALFSGMSPATAVPMQELAFSHIKDLMAQGMDPTTAGSVNADKKKEFMERTGKGTASLPDYYHDYWAGEHGDATRKKQAPQLSLLDTNSPPEQKGMLYPSQKWNSVAQYHKLHPTLTALVQKYGADGRAITREVLAMKSAGKDPAFRGKPKVEGFAPKTIRYLLAMMGAGNIHVPDTHYIRHTFGLPSDKVVKAETRKWLGRDLTPEEAIFEPNAHLKSVLWNARTPDIGEGLDNFYYHNHPAVKHVIERHFGGQPDEQAIFPAFWAHWLSVAPHERALGMDNQMANAGTDHRVYFNAVNEILKKYGLPTTRVRKNEEAEPENVVSMPIAERTARAHSEVAKIFGETPGMMFYYQHCVPALLESHDARKNQAVDIDPNMMKMEALLIELRKAATRTPDWHLEPPAFTADGTRLIQRGVGQMKGKDPKDPNPQVANVARVKILRPAAGRHLLVQHPEAAPAIMGKKFVSQEQVDVKHPAKDLPVDHPEVFWRGWHVKPGHAVVQGVDEIYENGGGYGIADGGKGYKVLERTPDHIVIMNGEKPMKVSMGEAKKLTFLSEPQKIRKADDAIIDAGVHGHDGWNVAPEQKELIHGMNLSDDTKHLGAGNGGINAGVSHWRILPNGKRAYVKAAGVDLTHNGAPDTVNEIAYVNAARNVMGMGQYVKNGAAFKHPHTGETNFVVEGIPSGFHEEVEQNDSYSSKDVRESVQAMKKNGDLHKLAMMNHILGNNDRHSGNYMWEPQSDGTAQLKMIDHGGAFTIHRPETRHPNYLTDGMYDRPLEPHPEAVKWLNSIDEKALAESLRKSGLNEHAITKALDRLYNAKFHTQPHNNPTKWTSKLFYND